jgi:ribosomal protein S18 acetylase RimI-like enzyme
MDVKIRPLKVIEVPKISRFRKKYDYSSPVSDGVTGSRIFIVYTIFKMLLQKRRIVTLVAEINNEIVGYLTLIFGRTGKFQGNVYLTSAAVKEDMRSRGIGSKLFKEAEDLARQRNARRIEFDVFADNTRAVELYKRLGYEVEGRKRQAVQSSLGTDDLLFMAKILD